MPFNDRPYFRRLLDFDDAVRRGRPVTCESFANRWETSTKTVQRFVDQIRTDFGAPVEFDRKKRSFVYSDPTWRLPFLDVSGADLFAIGVAMKVFQIYEGTPVLRDLKSTFERISRLLPESVRIQPSSLVERLWVHPQPVRAVAKEVWAAVANALREKTQLEIDYRKPTGETSNRLVEPLVLVHMNWDWFLAARDPEDGKTKTFYLARIKAAKNTNFHFTPPKDFDAAKHFGDSIGLYVGGKPFRFKVKVAKEIAPWITEVRWHPAQKLEELKNGDVVLDLPAGSMIEAKRFVLSLGRFGKALGPKELVGEMKEEVGLMRKEYGAA
ncbi:MAG TPA: WYL domain-containing protein [Thermoanaerobaculia bacterium]|nr:WYL domain-containing protein [Thermoanaerobaculia bacterium]